MFTDQCQKVNQFFWINTSLLIGTTYPCQNIPDVEKKLSKQANTTTTGN